MSSSVESHRTGQYYDDDDAIVKSHHAHHERHAIRLDIEMSVKAHFQSQTRRLSASVSHETTAAMTHARKICDLETKYRSLIDIASYLKKKYFYHIHTCDLRALNNCQRFNHRTCLQTKRRRRRRFPQRQRGLVRRSSSPLEPLSRQELNSIKVACPIRALDSRPAGSANNQRL